MPTGPTSRARNSVAYFLLPVGAASLFHRVLSDELWVHSGGDAMELHTVAPDEVHAVVVQDHSAQIIVLAGHWQAARPVGTKYTLVTSVIAPGSNSRISSSRGEWTWRARSRRCREDVLEVAAT